jgi:hypothetical protein
MENPNIKTEKASKFTEEDAVEMRQPLALLRKWETVMNILWNFFVAYSEAEKAVYVESQDNSIVFQLGNGNKFEIGINLVNRKYLSLFVKIEDNEEFEATVNNIDAFGEEGIIKTVSNILTFAENVK